MRRAMVLAVSLTACSEYKLNPDDDPTPGRRDTGTDSNEEIVIPGDDSSPEPDTSPGDDACPDPDTSRGTVTIDDTCLIEAIPGTFTPIIEWSSTAPGDSYTTPVVGTLTDDDGDGDVDADDMPDIVVVGTYGLVTVLSGDGSGVHWTYNMSTSEPSTAAIGDLDGDGRPEVVLSGSAGIYALRGDGSVMWTHPSVEIGGGAICGGVAIYDLDGDGIAEVIQGELIIDGATGTTRGIGNHGRGTGYPGGTYAAFGVAADIDQDGVSEVVVGDALYDADGNTIWYNGAGDGFVAVANFDGDPEGEIVVAGSGNVRLQDDDGSILWSGNYTGSRIGPPTVADFDADGEPEIGVAGNGVYVVIETDGTLKWSNTVSDYSSGFTGSSVFDFEGDGAAEVVYADENDVWVYDGATGAVKLRESQHSSATCSEYPAVADVDLDGQAEIIFTSSAYSGTETGVTVIGDADGSWMPGRPVWNQHSYAITNIEDDGGVPATPVTNWHSYNNFRSGDIAAATGGAMSDAVPQLVEVCNDECDDGLLRVVFRLGNGGVELLPAGVVASLYARAAGSWTLLDKRTSGMALEPGRTTPGWVFDLDPADVPEGVLRFIVDDDDGTGWISECHEDNNSILISDGLCP